MRTEDCLGGVKDLHENKRAWCTPRVRSIHRMPLEFRNSYSLTSPVLALDAARISFAHDSETLPIRTRSSEPQRRSTTRTRGPCDEANPHDELRMGPVAGFTGAVTVALFASLVS